MRLYVLLSHLLQLRLKERWLAAYDEAVDQGVRPRKSVKEAYHKVRASGRLPEWMP